MNNAWLDEIEENAREGYSADLDDTLSLVHRIRALEAQIGESA